MSNVCGMVIKLRISYPAFLKSTRKSYQIFYKKR